MKWRLSKISKIFFFNMIFLISSSFAMEVDSCASLEQLTSEQIASWFDPDTQTGSFLRILGAEIIPSDPSSRPYTRYADFFLKIYLQDEEKKDLAIKIFKSIAERENQLKKTHFCFYHAQPKWVGLVQDLVHTFYKVFQQRDLGNRIPLRITYPQFAEFVDANELISDKDKKRSVFDPFWAFKFRRWDSNPIPRKLCLAATPTLFCGISGDAKPDIKAQDLYFSENPLSFFFIETSKGGGSGLDNSFSQENLLKEVFDFFGIGEYESEGKVLLQHLLKEKTELNTESGELLQICLPKSLANFVFFCCKGGAPLKKYKCCSKICSEKIYCTCGNTKNKELIDTFCVLESLCLNPENVIGTYRDFANKLFLFDHEKDLLSPIINRMQVRMYLKPEVFLDPGNDVQIYRYCLQPQHEIPVSRYQTELEAFANYILYKREHPTTWTLLFSHPVQYFQNWIGGLFNTLPQEHPLPK